MLTTRELPSTATVEVVVGEEPAPAPAVSHEIDRIWTAEQERRQHTLFNGRILSVREIGAAYIRASVTEYRCFIAQRVRPELFALLGVRPLAVSGVLRCADGLVFGRRSAATVQDAGLWEVAPSGGMEESSQGDIRSQILTELREEVGLSAEHVTGIEPFCVVEDDECHLVDIGAALEAPGVSTDAVLYAWRSEAGTEYDRLTVVAPGDVPAFITRSEVAPLTRALLSRYPYLKP